MKKRILTMGLAIMLFVACTEELNMLGSSSAEKKIVFVDDQLLLSDMERETHFVDSALQAAKNTVEPGTQDNSRVLSLNSREQMIKFFKYMNAAAESDGKWLFVFWDKSSERIVDLSGREKDGSVYVYLELEEFKSKLKHEEIDFKLIEVANEHLQEVVVHKKTKSFVDEGDLIPTDTMFEKLFYTATGYGSVWSGSLCTQLVWYKKKAYIGYVLKNPNPGIEGYKTFMQQCYFGDYYETSSSFTYSESQKK